MQTNGRKTDERILEMGLSHFHSLVREALEEYDEVELYPMVSIVTKKYRKQRMEDFMYSMTPWIVCSGLLSTPCFDDELGVHFPESHGNVVPVLTLNVQLLYGF